MDYKYLYRDSDTELALFENSDGRFCVRVTDRSWYSGGHFQSYSSLESACAVIVFLASSLGFPVHDAEINNVPFSLFVGL